MDVVERKPSTFGGGTIIVKCKDFSIIQLDIVNTDDFGNVADSIEDLSNIGRFNCSNDNLACIAVSGGCGP